MASMRLEFQLKSFCRNMYAVDVFYWHLFYIRFVHLTSKNKPDCIDKMVMNIFYSHDKMKIIHKKEVHILHELRNVKIRKVPLIIEIHVLAEPAVNNKSI